MDSDRVTGVRVDVELVVAMPPDRLWDLVSDVTRIGEWSPEVEHGAWLDGPAPRVGARFEGRNRFPTGNVATTVCVVTAAERPRTFAWVVLTDEEDPERPGSIWRYDLLPADSPDSTLVRHTFVHGPGRTGLRVAVEQDPARAESHLDARLTQLHRNMSQTIIAMAHPAQVSERSHHVLG